MPVILTLKDRIREVHIFNRRAATAMVMAVLLVFSLIARLIYLQVIGYEHYATLSNDNRVNITPIPPTRGLIYDRNGILLAQNVPSFSLELVPEQVPDLDETLLKLAELMTIGEEDLQRFRKLVEQQPGFEAIPLRFRLSDEEVSRFAVNRHRFPGVDIAARLVRNYPLGARAVHAVGYVGRINETELRNVDPSEYRGTSHIGKIGIEKSYEEILHGTVGVQHVEVNAGGRMLRVLRETLPMPGKNLILTIDARLQAAAEDFLDGRRGSIVAIDPPTGDVLALVSMPTYDPNPFVVGIEPKLYADLQTSLDLPLFNRAIQGEYPPGSTIKPFVALAGLEYGKITPDTRTFCSGAYSLGNSDHKYRDWKKGGHGNTNLTMAISESCDVYFYDLAHELGIDAYYTFLSQFGFGRATRIDLEGERSARLPSREWKRREKKEIWYPGETLIAGIGQGYNLATPLQLAVATATLANRGVRVRPRTVRAFQDPRDSVQTPLPVESLATVKLNQPENWDIVVAGMIDVVHGKKGTARIAGKDAQYIMAGKTGTAQMINIKQDERYVESEIDERLRDHALFIAFAPVDKPRIAVAIIVENGGSGAGIAAPIARKVIDYYFSLQDQTNARQ